MENLPEHYRMSTGAIGKMKRRIGEGERGRRGEGEEKSVSVSARVKKKS